MIKDLNFLGRDFSSSRIFLINMKSSNPGDRSYACHTVGCKFRSESVCEGRTERFATCGSTCCC